VRAVDSGAATRQAMVIVSRAASADHTVRTIVDVDGHAHLCTDGGRRCASCGMDALVGNGYRRRTYQFEPVRFGRKREALWAYRVVCSVCHKNDTVLPPQLGPHKRYVVTVIEQALVSLDGGTAKARVSAALGGISPERLRAWHDHFQQSVAAVRRSVEAIVASDPLFHLPAAMPEVNIFSYLAMLLSQPLQLGLFVLVNLRLSSDLPLRTHLLLHPPTSTRPCAGPYPSAPAGGMPFG
jgi:hypothetical protein